MRPRRHTSTVYTLASGWQLGNPREAAPAELALGDWVDVDGEPWQIRDMRALSHGGRVVLLDGRQPLVMRPNQMLRRFTLYRPGTIRWAVEPAFPEQRHPQYEISPVRQAVENFIAARDTLD